MVPSAISGVTAMFAYELFFIAEHAPAVLATIVWLAAYAVIIDTITQKEKD